jgi:hypothetical protein
MSLFHSNIPCFSVISVVQTPCWLGYGLYDHWLQVWFWEHQRFSSLLPHPDHLWGPTTLLSSKNEGCFQWEYGCQGMHDYSNTSTWKQRLTVNYSTKSLMVLTIYGLHMCNSELLVAVKINRTVLCKTMQSGRKITAASTICPIYGLQAQKRG